MFDREVDSEVDREVDQESPRVNNKKPSMKSRRRGWQASRQEAESGWNDATIELAG